MYEWKRMLRFNQCFMNFDDVFCLHSLCVYVSVFLKRLRDSLFNLEESNRFIKQFKRLSTVMVFNLRFSFRREKVSQNPDWPAKWMAFNEKLWMVNDRLDRISNLSLFEFTYRLTRQNIVRSTVSYCKLTLN